MLEKRIAEFAAGDEIQNFFLIRKLDLRISSNNKEYFDLTLADATGEINAKLWNVGDEEKASLAAGGLVKVRGHVQEWRNNLQFKVVKIRVALEEDGVRIEDFVKSAPLEAQAMYDELMGYIDGMSNDHIARLCRHLYEERREKLLYYPAAKSNHHAIRSGLLYHLLRMLRSAQALAGVYENIDTDLLYAGVLLHDLEKLSELDSDEQGICDYTVKGNMIGHINMAVVTIEKVGETLGVPEEEIMLLQHMVLSHHYQPEYGSPKKPMIKEAELLHYVDMIDARMFDFEEIIGGLQPGELSEPVWSLDRRRIYRRK